MPCCTCCTPNSGTRCFTTSDTSTPPSRTGRLYNQGYIQAYAYRDQRGQVVDATEVAETEDGWQWRGKPVTREFGQMGKSLKDSVNPDDLYVEYRADTFRLYEMSMAPLDVFRPWETRAAIG